VEAEVAVKPKGLLISVVLLAVLGGIVWWSNRRQAEAGKSPTDAAKKMISVAEDQVQQIKTKKVTGEVIDLQRKDGKWEMVQPKPLPADQDAVSSMLSNLTSLNADKVIEEKAADLKAYGLDDPTLDIQVTRKDGKSDHLLVGDDTPTGSGAYAKLANDPRVFSIASFVKSSLDKTPNDLRDKRLLRFDSDKLSRVELQAKGQTFEFGKNASGEWQIVKPRPLRADFSAVDTLVNKLRDAKLDPLNMDEDAAKKFDSGAKTAVATVTDAGGTQTLEVRKDSTSAYYAKSSVVEGVHKIGADVGDSLDKGLDDFRNKKVFDFGFSDPSKLEIKGVAYTKTGDKWMSGSKAMDNTSVQNLIDKLRDLAATKFPDQGGGDPVFDATVTSNEGKRVEKVVIRKLGARFLAQREGEPSIYELDPNAVAELEKAAAEVKEAAPEPAKKK
jgi:hypothetical protein